MVAQEVRSPQQVSLDKNHSVGRAAFLSGGSRGGQWLSLMNFRRQPECAAPSSSCRASHAEPRPSHPGSLGLSSKSLPFLPPFLPNMGKAMLPAQGKEGNGNGQWSPKDGNSGERLSGVGQGVHLERGPTSGWGHKVHEWLGRDERNFKGERGQLSLEQLLYVGK